MANWIKNAGLASAIVALASAAACSKQPEADASLKADLAAIGGAASALELAPSATKSRMVVSELEGGPRATPKPVAKVRTPRPSPRKAPTVASKQLPVDAPTPSEIAASEPSPAAHSQAPAIQSPRQAPAPAQQQDRRVYKTEAEIFRQMPWIRP